MCLTQVSAWGITKAEKWLTSPKNLTATGLGEEQGEIPYSWNYVNICRIIFPKTESGQVVRKSQHPMIFNNHKKTEVHFMFYLEMYLLGSCRSIDIICSAKHLLITDSEGRPKIHLAILYVHYPTSTFTQNWSVYEFRWDNHLRQYDGCQKKSRGAQLLLNVLDVIFNQS